MSEPQPCPCGDAPPPPGGLNRQERLHALQRESKVLQDIHYLESMALGICVWLATLCAILLLGWAKWV